MNKITIVINTVNAAFEDMPEYEVVRILRELADKLETGRQPDYILDINGNNVGSIKYE
jgi:hypothetical protein